MAEPADPLRSAGEQVLARLVRSEAPSPVGPTDGADGIDGIDGPVQVVRDGAALLLRRADVLVRVRPAPAGGAVAEREVRLAEVLAGSGVPVTGLVGDGQPWTVDGCVVTAWRWVRGGPAPGPGALGRLARTLRERTSDRSATVPVLDPIEAVLDAVAHLPAGDAEAAWVRRRAGELAGPWADAADDDPLGRAVVHGDLHVGNVVSGPDGLLLTDLELTGSGPPSYDAAPTAVAVARYGADPTTLVEFLDGFGADPTTWSGFATFVEVYELWVTAWAVGVRHQDPTWAAEAARRVRTLRDATAEPWTLS